MYYPLIKFNKIKYLSNRNKQPPVILSTVNSYVRTTTAPNPLPHITDTLEPLVSCAPEP